MRLESVTVLRSACQTTQSSWSCLPQELDEGRRPESVCQLSPGRMPHPSFRKHSITPGRPGLGRQQMPMFGDIRYITLSRQIWLQDRFPCHVGLLAELCSNPEAYHLQQTLTIVWDHLLFTSGFRASSWPPHTFFKGLLTHTGWEPRSGASAQQPRPRDGHGFAGRNLAVCFVCRTETQPRR